jgi:hypothetical protein
VKPSYITSLDSAYKHESDVDMKERILLVRRVMSDGKELATVCKEELHRSKAWAYKWYKRYCESINREYIYIYDNIQIMSLFNDSSIIVI